MWTCVCAHVGIQKMQYNTMNTIVVGRLYFKQFLRPWTELSTDVKKRESYRFDMTLNKRWQNDPFWLNCGSFCETFQALNTGLVWRVVRKTPQQKEEFIWTRLVDGTLLRSFLTLFSNGVDIKLCEADMSLWNTAGLTYGGQINVRL